MARSAEAESIDQVLSEVIADDDTGGLRAIASTGTEVEAEAARLAASIRRVVAPDAGVTACSGVRMAGAIAKTKSSP